MERRSLNAIKELLDKLIEVQTEHEKSILDKLQEFKSKTRTTFLRSQSVIHSNLDRLEAEGNRVLSELDENEPQIVSKIHEISKIIKQSMKHIKEFRTVANEKGPLMNLRGLVAHDIDQNISREDRERLPEDVQTVLRENLEENKRVGGSRRRRRNMRKTAKKK